MNLTDFSFVGQKCRQFIATVERAQHIKNKYMQTGLGFTIFLFVVIF